MAANLLPTRASHTLRVNRAVRRQGYPAATQPRRDRKPLQEQAGVGAEDRENNERSSAGGTELACAHGGRAGRAWPGRRCAINYHAFLRSCRWIWKSAVGGERGSRCRTGSAGRIYGSLVAGEGGRGPGCRGWGPAWRRGSPPECVKVPAGTSQAAARGQLVGSGCVGRAGPGRVGSARAGLDRALPDWPTCCPLGRPGLRLQSSGDGDDGWGVAVGGWWAVGSWRCLVAGGLMGGGGWRPSRLGRGWATVAKRRGRVNVARGRG